MMYRRINPQYDNLPEEVLRRLKIIKHIPGSLESPYKVMGQLDLPSIDILWDPTTGKFYQRLLEMIERSDGPHSIIFGYDELTPQGDPRLSESHSYNKHSCSCCDGTSSDGIYGWESKHTKQNGGK